MSKHDISSFNESEAVNLLSSVLESKHTIKTFFSANDKTPNNDGFFELVDKESTPKKQFIVQIKKVENLEPNIQGKNKGKYVYSLKTNFLYYVKAKITESPAIYFVVDIATKTIFWVYLSDELLMSLNFEGHEYISFAFGSENILQNITKFTSQLDKIANKRNVLFLRKSKEEIVQLQDALDYINHLFDYDLCNIKKSIFPNLWRFGIKFSETSDTSIESKGEIFTPKSSSLLALYPQIKGIADTGIQEFTFDNLNIFNKISLVGKIQPMQYAKESIRKALKLFFENGIPAQYLPDIVLQEKIWNFIEKTNEFFDNNEIKKITTEEIQLRFHLFLKYIGTILFSKDLSKSEIQVKNIIFNRLINKKNFLDITSIISFGCTEAFKEFCKKEKNNPFPIHEIVFELINRDSIEIICIINELKNRSIYKVAPVWEYEWYTIRQMKKDQFLYFINEITAKWLNNLPAIYNETYSNLIDNPKYKYNNNNRIIYKNYSSELEYGINRFYTLVHKYTNKPFSIHYDESLSREFTDESRKNGLSNIISGIMLDDFIDKKLLYFESLNCLIYKGICEKLGFEPEPLNIDSANLSRGLSLF